MRVSNYDPTKPIGSWRTAWRTLTKQAGLPGLRFHDMRHQAVTELLERGVPEQTVMEIAGHVDPRMLKRYSHVRLETKRKALEVLSRRPSQPVSGAPEQGGYDTKNDTNPPSKGAASLQLLEKNGRRERARTSDLYRVNFRPWALRSTTDCDQVSFSHPDTAALLHSVSLGISRCFSGIEPCLC